MRSGKKIRLTCVDLWEEMDSWVMNDQHEIWSAPLPELNQMLLRARAYVEQQSTNGFCYEAFAGSLQRCGVSDIVEPLNMSSEEAGQLYPPGAIDFVLIDADHSYQGVRDDLESWCSKVRKGGIICGDDFNDEAFPGVGKALQEFFAVPVQTVASAAELVCEENRIHRISANQTWVVFL